MRLKLAVIGTKFISRLFTRAAILSGMYEPYAICSRSRERGESYVREFGFQKAVQTVEQVASDPEVDVVYIATPNALHFEHAETCLRMGKHVIVEKPSFADTAQLKQMLVLAAERGVFLFEAMRSVHNPNYAEIKRQLKRIGQIRYARFSLMRDFLHQKDPVTGAPSAVFLPESSGGCNYHLGVYGINAALYFFGKPEEVRYTSLRSSAGVDIVGLCTLLYPGMVCSVTSSIVSRDVLPNEIQGEEGTITMDYVVTPQAADLCLAGAKEPLAVRRTDDDMRYEAEAFASIIQTKDRNAYDVLTAAMTSSLEILEECRRQSSAVV